MANNWYGNWFGNTPSDPSTFDYDTASQKVQRQRAAAQALQAVGSQTNQGQFIKSGDFMGYAGGNTAGSTIARIVAAALGGAAHGSADDSQKQVNVDSQNALSLALNPNNSPAAKRAAAEQMQREADMERQREFNRLNDTVQAGDQNNPQTSDDQATVEAFSVPSPVSSDIQTAPLSTSGASPTARKAAAKALSANKLDLKTAPNSTAQPLTGGPNSFGTGADLFKTLAKKTNLPVDAKGPISADDAVFAARMLSGTPTANTPESRQNVTKTPRALTSIPALPNFTAQPQVAPQVVPPSQQSETLESRARALGMDPTAPRGPGDPTLAQQVQEVEDTRKQMANGTLPETDSRSLVDQARESGNENASYGDKIAQLQQISRTGPMGQQLATSMMQQMFTHADRYDFKMNDSGDAVVFDKWSGKAVPVQGMTNTLKVDQADIERRKLVDPTNSQSVAEYNAWRHQRGMPQLDSQTIAGSNMGADARYTAHKGEADSISSISQRRGEAAAQVADLGKINRDLQTGMVLANQAAGKWGGVQASISQYWGGESAQARQMLERILNDTQLMSIMQDKGGSGSAGVGLMKAYQDHGGMNAKLTPQAVQQGLQQIQQAVQERLISKQSEVDAHDYALGKFGYQSNQQQHGAGSTPSGRAPGNYSF